jgi:hypothetical protein
VRRPQEKPQKPEILVAEAATRVIKLLREEDAIIGGLTDKHVKWLLMFAYTQFSVREATICFDFHSKPKQIFITPLRKGQPFKVSEWAKIKFKLKWQKVERDLAPYLKLDQFKITFNRTAPNVAYRLENNHAQD